MTPTVAERDDAVAAAPILRGRRRSASSHDGIPTPSAIAVASAGDEPPARGVAATVAWALAPRGTAAGPAGLASAATPASAGAPADDPIDLRQAHRIATERGHAAGQAEGRAELAAAIASAAAVADRLEALAPARTASVARSIAEVAVAIARRVIGAELRTDPALLVHAIEAAITVSTSSSETRVLLHPAAVDVVRAAWEAAHGASHLGRQWSFEADPSLRPGDCLVRFDHGFIDAGIEAQLGEIEAALEAAIPGLWSGERALTIVDDEAVA